jgi:hypothetical protein
VPADCQQTTRSRRENALSAVRFRDWTVLTDHLLGKPVRG